MLQLPVLYVEDEPNDALLLELGFKRAGLGNPLLVLPDGRQATQYLAGAGAYADRQRHPLPCLVLLDLNLPVMSGFETLEWIRRQPELKKLPVVIFSSSTHPSDMEKAQTLGADDYLCKPVDMVHMTSLLHRLAERWLTPPSTPSAPSPSAPCLRTQP